MPNFQQITLFFSYSPKRKTRLNKAFDEQTENHTGNAADDVLADNINEETMMQSGVTDVDGSLAFVTAFQHYRILDS